MRAHIFDMDGTLLRGTTASLLIARILDREADLRWLETSYAAGTHSTVAFAEALHGMWGVPPVETIRTAFFAAPLLKNVGDVLSDIHARGERACLITLSPDYFAEHFLSYGFDAVYASRFPREALTPFDPTGILSFDDKPRLAGEFCAEYGLQLEQAVAYGDSMSDVPLFERVGYRISINGDHHIREKCDVEIQTDDLWDAYSVARRHIDEASPDF